MKKFLLVCLLASAGIASIFAGAAARKATHTPQPFKSYTVSWNVTDYDAAGSPTYSYTETRYQSASGRWSDLKVFRDGRREQSFSEPGRGVYVVREKELSYIGSAQDAPKSTATLDKMKDSRQFVRWDTVLGFPVAVMNIGDAKLPVEVSLAPALDGTMLRMVIRDPDSTRVMEPVAFTAGEPSPEVFAHPELPESRATYEKMHK